VLGVIGTILRPNSSSSSGLLSAPAAPRWACSQERMKSWEVLVAVAVMVVVVMMWSVGAAAA
jgi:hypothetical protein